MNLIPIRDRIGNIIGLQTKEEIDAVQATINESMKTLGATELTSPPTPSVPVLRFELIALLFVVAVVALGIAVSRNQEPRKVVLPSTETAVPTATRTATAEPTVTITRDATQASTDEPTATPESTSLLEPTFALAPPPQPEVIWYCADRFSDWGNTHQCATTQQEADALADAEIHRINAPHEAKPLELR